jgi:hypothetical protein
VVRRSRKAFQDLPVEHGGDAKNKVRLKKIKLVSTLPKPQAGHPDLAMPASFLPAQKRRRFFVRPP